MLARKAFEVDVDLVLDELSEANKEELALLGKDLDSAREEAHRYAQQFPCTAFIHDKQVVAVFGCKPDEGSPTLLFTWFLATEAFWKTGIVGVRFARRHMTGLAASYPNQGIYTISVSKRPQVSKWMAALGAKRIHQDEKASVFAF